MSATDAAGVRSGLGRPLAVLAGAWPGADRARTLLLSGGHRVHLVATTAELADVTDREAVAVAVVRAESLRSVTWDRDVRGVLARATGPSGVGEVYAVHASGADVVAMWRTHRQGAVPWVLTPEGALPPVVPHGAFAGEIALDALHEDLLGRHASACSLLASIRDPEAIVEVLDVLAGAGAAAMERLRNRCRYPVPTEVLESHLPAHVGTLAGPDYALWWSMVETVAFRASGLRLPSPEAELIERPFAVASAAFHATSTIVRFTARRQWRRADELLADLAAVG